MFISGPNDSLERSRQIISTLQHSCGPDGFHYMVAVAARHSLTRHIATENDEDAEDTEDDWDEEEDSSNQGRLQLPT